MKKIAITGNIGSGKTTISNILLQEGYEVFQCDKEISKLYSCSDLKKEIKKVFNNKVENLFFRNGKVNKKSLSDYVFSSPTNLKKLENIIYPHLEIVKKTFLKKNKRTHLLFFDIPLLFEKNIEDQYNHIIYLVLNKKTQKNRVLRRRNMNEDKFKKILKNQRDFSRSKKISLILDTNKKKVEVKKNLLDFIKNIKKA